MSTTESFYDLYNSIIKSNKIMAEHQPVSSLAASVRSVRDQINFDDNSNDSNENVTYNTFVTDMDTNEIIPCHIEAVELPEYDSPVEEERQKSTNMDSNENIPNNMAEEVEKNFR